MHRQSSEFLEYVKDNFLVQMLEKLTRGKILPNLLLIHKGCVYMRC